MKGVRYSSHSDPRYLRLLETSRAWKERNKNSPVYKQNAAERNHKYYLRARDTEEFRQKRLDFQRKYWSTPEGRRKAKKFTRSFRNSNILITRAYSAVEYALRVGKLKRPKRCEECGHIPPPRRDGRSQIQAHHENYALPLIVVWLCRSCHGKLARKH